MPIVLNFIGTIKLGISGELKWGKKKKQKKISKRSLLNP